MSSVLNVTPDEFSNIRLAAATMPEADFAKFMHEWFGCEYFGSYKLIVRRDVPSIPWLSQGVERIEN